MDARAAFIHVAAVRYRDACLASNERHPDCPFAVESTSGRTCNMECGVELTRLSRPGFNGISAYQSSAYNPLQVLMGETTRTPNDEWHTGSLLQVVQLAALPAVDSDGVYLIEREIEVTNALAMLARRGYDPDVLIRQGLAHLIPVVVTLHVCGAYMAPDRAALPKATQEWLRYLQDHIGALGGEATSASQGQVFAMAQRSGFLDCVGRWLAQAPLIDIIRWAPTDVSDDAPPPNDGEARWILERFGFASLLDWGTQSLHHEHRWVNGYLAPVGVDEMFHRIIPSIELDREIARRAVEARPAELGELTRQALVLLGEGRRSEAAALFDAVRVMEPQNVEAYNNYAFCVTPDDPAAALAALREAAEHDPSPSPLNLVNQAIALRGLNEPRAALAAANQAWDDYRRLPRIAWMWTNWDSASGPSVTEVDLPLYLAELGVELARALGDEVGLNEWHEHLAEERGGLTG